MRHTFATYPGILLLVPSADPREVYLPWLPSISVMDFDLLLQQRCPGVNSLYLYFCPWTIYQGTATGFLYMLFHVKGRLLVISLVTLVGFQRHLKNITRASYSLRNCIASLFQQQKVWIICVNNFLLYFKGANILHTWNISTCISIRRKFLYTWICCQTDTTLAEKHAQTLKFENYLHLLVINMRTICCWKLQNNQLHQEEFWQQPWERMQVKHQTSASHVGNVLLKVITWKDTWEPILGRNHTRVSYVRNHLLKVVIWKCTWEPILGRNHTNVSYVINHLPKAVIWKYTWESIMERNHTYVSYVRNHLLKVIIWKYTWESILERNHTYVSYVRNHFLEVVSWRNTWEPILGRNHTNVCYLRHRLLKVVIWKHTWEPILERNHTYVSYVINHLLNVVSLRHTYESILERNHTCVSHVRNYLLEVVIWRRT